MSDERTRFANVVLPHLADAFAPTPGWSGRIFVFEAGRRRYRWVLGSMDDLLVVG